MITEQKKAEKEIVYGIIQGKDDPHFYACIDFALGDKIVSSVDVSEWCYELSAVTVMGAFKEAIVMGINVDRTKWIDVTTGRKKYCLNSGGLSDAFV